MLAPMRPSPTMAICMAHRLPRLPAGYPRGDGPTRRTRHLAGAARRPSHAGGAPRRRSPTSRSRGRRCCRAGRSATCSPTRPQRRRPAHMLEGATARRGRRHVPGLALDAARRADIEAGAGRTRRGAGRRRAHRGRTARGGVRRAHRRRPGRGRATPCSARSPVTELPFRRWTRGGGAPRRPRARLHVGATGRPSTCGSSCSG